MAVATNKRRYEEIEECNTLHVIGIRADPTFLRSVEFKDKSGISSANLVLNR